FQLCRHPFQVADMNAVHKNIEVTADLTIGTEKVRLEGGILKKGIFDQFGNGHTGHAELTLVIHIIFHQGRESDNWHKNIIREMPTSRRRTHCAPLSYTVHSS